MSTARNHELPAAIRAAVEKHKPFVSRPLLRRVALSEVAYWIGKQDGSLPADQAMVIAQEAIAYINRSFAATGEAKQPPQPTPNRRTR